MEIKIEKGSLLAGLYLAQGISDRKSTMPILANVLLRTDGKEKLLLAATDLNVTVTAEIPCKVLKDGGVTVGAKPFHEIVRSLPGDSIHFARTDNNYAEIRAGKVDYKLVGMADRDFPKLPNYHEVTFHPVDATTLLDMIKKTFFAISTDETRYHLNGVLFESDGKIGRMVATDGHRLCRVERPLEKGPKWAQGILVPRKGLVEIRRALENVTSPVEIGVHQGHLFLHIGDVVVSVKLIDAQFPPYEQVIPKENDKSVTVGRVALLEALKRISILSSDKTWGVKFSVKKDQVRLESDNPDLGEAHEELEGQYSGTPLSIGFNAKYFIDLLSEMDGDDIRVELSGELDPALVRPAEAAKVGGYLGVVMPMRI